MALPLSMLRAPCRGASLVGGNGGQHIGSSSTPGGDETGEQAGDSCCYEGDEQLCVGHRYVAEHVELDYATTTAQTQGRTVDTAHALIDVTTTREELYVAATRARQHTQLYLTTDPNLDLDAERPPPPDTQAADLLARIICRDTQELTATEVRREHHGRIKVAERARPTPRTTPSRLNHPARL